MDLWTKGTDVVSYEKAIRRVAEKDESLCVTTSNSFVRMVLLNVAFHWNLRVFTRHLKKQRKGDYYDMGSHVVELKEVHIARPAFGYVPPSRSLVDLRNSCVRLLGKGHYHKKWDSLKIKVFPEIAPLNEGETTAMSRHEVPRDVLAFIIALLPSLGAVARVRRVCRRWNDCAEQPNVWRSQLDLLLSKSQCARDTFLAMKTGSTDPRLLLRTLLVTPKAASCQEPDCFRLCHNHARPIPSRAVEMKRQDGSGTSSKVFMIL